MTSHIILRWTVWLDGTFAVLPAVTVMRFCYTCCSYRYFLCPYSYFYNFSIL